MGRRTIAQIALDDAKLAAEVDVLLGRTSVKCHVCDLDIERRGVRWLHVDTGVADGYVYRPHFAYPEEKS